jgi:hypothetical protein
VTTTDPPQSPALAYTGRPRDIDAIDNQWTQVVLHAAGADELISETSNDRIVQVLLLALTLNKGITVEYIDGQPPQLVAATLHLDAPTEDGQVQRIGINEADGYFRAALLQNGIVCDGWTQNRQIETVVQAAARGCIPVDADIDADTNKIVRAKVNVPIDD